MPSDYRCNSCHHCVSVGSYHYHGMPDGYLGRSLMFCLKCGTQHAIERGWLDRGPANYPVYKATLESVPPEARSAVVRWLRRDRKIGYNEALEAVRTMPCILFERTNQLRIDRVKDELASFGVELTVEQVGSEPNQNFGPPRYDRLLYTDASRPPSGKAEWNVGPTLAGPDASALQCAHCGAVESFSTENLANDSCPSCKIGALVLESQWMT